VPRGLVDVRVDADDELEPAHRAVQAAGVGYGHYRVTGDRDERPDPARARRLDLVGQGDRRKLAEHLR
jgi:hypothetical protein